MTIQDCPSPRRLNDSVLTPTEKASRRVGFASWYHRCLSVGVAAVLLLGNAQRPGAVAVGTAGNRIAWGGLPLVFEPNAGQTNAAVRFLSRGQGYTLFLTSTGATLALAPQDRGTSPRVLKMEFVGATGPASVSGREPRPGWSHYLVGSQQARWRRDVPHVGRVEYTDLYPGIDLVFYGHQRQLEYDLVVAPRADPAGIRLRFTGADTLRLGDAGELVVSLGSREIRQPAPFSYQETRDGRRFVRSRYRLLPGGDVAFEVGPYDQSTPLVIDPVLSYASYLGGSGNDSARAVAVDSQGNVYVGGTTSSSDLPVEGAYQSAIGGGTSDAFVTKLNAAGTDILYSTYLGGSGTDEGRGLAVDSAGSAYLVGQTLSTNFPSHSPLSSFHTSGDAFVAKLSPEGNALSYSVVFGSNGTDAANGVSLDGTMNAYVTGLWAGSDVFVHRLNAAASAWVYTRTLVGSSSDEGYGIGTDAAGNACVTGRTSSSNFPVLNALQPTLPGVYSPFVAKYDPAGTLHYATFLGGSSLDTGYGAAIDGAGRCFVVGSAMSTNFPTQNAAVPTAPGGTNAFVTVYSADGSAYVYSTYLGGSGGESAYGIAVDASGVAHVVGASSSVDFPSVNAIQAELRDLGAVFSSADAAASFSRVVLPGLAVQAIAVDPGNAQVAYAGTSNGVYKTTDGGAHWTRIDSGLTYRNVVALAIDPNEPCTILGGVDTGRFDINTNAMLIVSADCGANWGFYTDAPVGRVVRSLAFTHSAPAALYVGFIRNGDAFHTVGRRTTAGASATWHFSTPGYYPSVATDQVDACVAYTGALSGFVFVNTSCAVPAWTQVGDALTGLVNTIAPHPTTQGTLLAGTSAGLIYRKADATSPWVTVATIVGSVNRIVYKPGNPLVAYASGSGGLVFKTTDGGLTWTMAYAIGPAVSSLGVSANAPDALFASAGSGATDAFWTRLSPTGSVLDSTLVGGTGADTARAVALDLNGNPVFVGVTSALNLATDGAQQPMSGGAEDAFVAKIILTRSPGHQSDFTGDLKSDILWHHAGRGEVWLWGMEGASSAAQLHVRTLGEPGWEIRGVGDQTGDGKADVLWRNSLSGMLYLWTMNGSAIEAETYVDTVDPAYDIVGSGDYDGDGSSDILWRHVANGEVWVWLMDGATPLSQTYIETVDPGYVVQGSGDLNGDGASDLVWRHTTGGDVWVWQMQGATRTVAYVDTVAELDYRIVGVADHTGDGRADILWHHATRGEVWLWPMTGTTRVSQSYVGTVPETDYRIVGSGDYDGDGKADVLWHHATRGEVWVWLMNGATKLSETYVATVPDVEYRIVRAR